MSDPTQKPPVEAPPPPPDPRAAMPPHNRIVQNCAESILLLLEMSRMEIPKPVTISSDEYEVVIRRKPGIFRPRPKIVIPGR